MAFRKERGTPPNVNTMSFMRILNLGIWKHTRGFKKHQPLFPVRSWLPDLPIMACLLYVIMWGIRPPGVPKNVLCGRHSATIVNISGRNEDFIITPEGTSMKVHSYLFKDTREIQECQVVQYKLGGNGISNCETG